MWLQIMSLQTISSNDLNGAASRYFEYTHIIYIVFVYRLFFLVCYILENEIMMWNRLVDDIFEYFQEMGLKDFKFNISCACHKTYLCWFFFN